MSSGGFLGFILNPINNLLNKFTKGSSTEWYTIKTTQAPNTDFIMDYVYGSLKDGMDDYHKLSHLIDDEMVELIEPRTMTGAVTGANPMAVTGAVTGAAGGFQTVDVEPGAPGTYANPVSKTR